MELTKLKKMFDEALQEFGVRAVLDHVSDVMEERLKEGKTYPYDTGADIAAADEDLDSAELRQVITNLRQDLF